MRRWRSSTFC